MLQREWLQLAVRHFPSTDPISEPPFLHPPRHHGRQGTFLTEMERDPGFSPPSHSRKCDFDLTHQGVFRKSRRCEPHQRRANLIRVSAQWGSRLPLQQAVRPVLEGADRLLCLVSSNLQMTTELSIVATGHDM